MDIKDFKNVSVTFVRGNQDAKEKLIEIMKITGRTKVDIICEALRQYDPYKNFNERQQNLNNDTNKINLDVDDIKAIVEQSVANILSKQGINNKSINNMQNLENKKIDKKFMDED